MSGVNSGCEGSEADTLTPIVSGMSESLGGWYVDNAEKALVAFLEFTMVKDLDSYHRRCPDSPTNHKYQYGRPSEYDASARTHQSDHSTMDSEFSS